MKINIANTFMNDLEEKGIILKEAKKGNCSEMIYQNNIYHDYFREIPFRTLKKLLSKNNINLSSKTLLVAGCGNGTDVLYLRKYYSPKIYVSDISQEAISKTIKSFDNIHGIGGDSEKLPFKDSSFDYSFVAASLHHLKRPQLGLFELLRVARYGVIVIEPNDSILTRLATKLGLAQEVEKCGNYVFRFAKREVIKIAMALFCKCSIMRCFAIHKVARTRFGFYIIKAMNDTANKLCSFWGNYIVFIIKK